MPAPIGRLPAPISARASDTAIELKRPTLNEWQPVAETRLPQSVSALIKEHGLENGSVMLTGANEFVVGTAAGEKALLISKDDPDDARMAFQVRVGHLDRTGSFDFGRPPAAPEPDARRNPNSEVVGDVSTRSSQTRQEVGGAMALRLGADKGIMFSDLPKSVQDDVKTHIEQHNASQRGSFSPQKIEFLRAKKLDDGFDVTFLTRDWTGQAHGERTERFGALPLTPPPTPRPTDAAVTSLEALPRRARAAIEERLADLTQSESMSMSPKTFTFVSATPLSDGGFDVKLNARGFFGDSNDISQKLHPDGSWN